MMATAAAEGLLRDAGLILDYAARAGRLPDGSLAKAVAAVEEARTPDTVGTLVIALNAGVRAISPMTLVELRAGRSPFNARYQRGARLGQLLLGALTVLLAVLVAYCTQLLHEEDAALRALQNIQDARPLEKLNAARKMVQLERVLERGDSQYDQYHRAVSELRDLQDRIAGAYQLASAVTVKPAWPRGVLSYLTAALNAARHAIPAAANNAPEHVLVLAAREPEATGPPRTHATSPRDGSHGLTWNPCSPPDNAAPVTIGEQREIEWLCGVLTDVKNELQFSAMLGLGLYSTNLLPIASLTYQIQAQMAALSGWILPLLYGFLGSSVFLMRNMLDTRTPNIELLPAVLRVALGGIAGIVIGWFWVPPPTRGTELAAITSAPFALAFLVGFSIDILFSLLDRLNRAITDERAPKSPTSPAEAAGT